MNESTLAETMQEAMADVQLAPEVFGAAQRHHRRQQIRRRSAAGISLAVIAVGTVSVVSSHRPPSPAAAGGPIATNIHTVAYVTKQLHASLAEDNSYLIISKVIGGTPQVTMTTWLDPATGNRRLLLDTAAGQPQTETGVTVDGHSATLTTLDYANRTVTTTTEPQGAIDESSRMGVNVPSPTDIRNQLAAATLVDEGQVQIDGHNTEQLRMTVPVPAGSSLWAPGTDIELYVDTTTYQLVRVTFSDSGSLLYTDDLTWTPRAAADLSQATLQIPAGFSGD
ncbi:MAG TPA: hypothetical protein VHV76_00270 [Mycobacteriales bacterium]|nr:hypothetical protein [Mycobacteriales bacterium]